MNLIERFLSRKSNTQPPATQTWPKLDLSPEFSILKDHLAQVEKLILSQAQEFDPGVAGYLEFIWKTKGKRLRPALTLFTAGTAGSILPNHITLAMIIELIHLASLVHDDVMDHADIRRGALTAYKRWGAEIAVLLGDCLFAHALKSCSNLPQEAAREIASAANEVCSGEILQTQRQFDLNLDLHQYYKIIGMKTGALFRISAQLASLLLNNTPEQQTAMREFGHTFGIGYQIYDDCLDFIHLDSATGKTSGTDLESGKITLPLLLLLDQANDEEKQRLSGIILHGTRREKNRLAEQVVHSPAMNQALRTLENRFSEARTQLSTFPNSPYRKALENITQKITHHLRSLIQLKRSEN